MLKGLQYVGNGRGTSVMLYKSYKSVDVTWDKPYTFTNKDIVNDDAKKYYSRNYSPLGIKVIEDNTILPELESDKELEEKEVVTEVTPNETVEGANEVESEDKSTETAESEIESGDESSNEVAIEESVSDPAYPKLIEILASIKDEYDSETISSISESDLCSLLDERLDDDRVNELAYLVGYSIGRTKNKYKIISGLASSKLNEVVNLILA